MRLAPGQKPWVSRQFINGAPEGRWEMNRRLFSDSNAIAPLFHEDALAHLCVRGR